MRTLENKEVVTRKPHRCQACGKVSPAKSRMHYCVTVDEPDFFAAYWCAPCVAFMSTQDQWDLEYDGDIWECDGYAEFRGAYDGAEAPTMADL